ncbi:MAG: GAF domain-containing protein [Chthoniobacterales bacterium]
MAKPDIDPKQKGPSNEEELGRLNRILKTLYQCNYALVHAHNELQLFQSVCRILVEVGGLRLAWVGHCEEDQEKTVRPVAMAGEGRDYVEKAKISWSDETERGRGPTGIALRTGKPYWVKDNQTDPTIAPWRAEAIAQGYASCIALPLIAHGKRIGNLSLYAGETNAFNESTIEHYTDLANNLAYGVAALRSREEAREHALKLSRANEVLRRSLEALARDKHLQSFVDHVLMVLTEQLGGHSSTLWLIDVERRAAHLHSVCEEGHVVVAEHADHPNAHEPRIWEKDDPEWIALQMNRPFLHHDPVHDPRLKYTPAQQARFSSSGIQALLLIPLVFGRQLVGALSVRIASHRELDQDDLEFAHSLAQQATLAIELARLAEQAQLTALANEKEKAAQERVAEITKANEALRGCLDALASVPELDEFLGQVMGAMTRQLGAASSVLRLRDFEQNVLTLDLVFQQGRVMTPAEAKYPVELRTVPLDERQANLLKPPASVLRLLDPNTHIPDRFRTYLLGLGARTSLVIPLNLGGQLVGSVTFRFTEDREFRPEEIEIARALATQASLAIQLTRLAKGARQSAVLAERNELVGEIHDSLAQLFTGISMQLGAAKKVMERGGNNTLNYVERAIELAQFGLAEARRSAFSFQPSVIEEFGLVRAMEKLAERSNIPGRLRCELSVEGVTEDTLPPTVQENLLRIAQEAISNAVRHAKPTVVMVSLRADAANLFLKITDDGSGIANPRDADRDGFGLSNMQARAENMGAGFEMVTVVGQGTSIGVRLPLRE